MKPILIFIYALIIFLNISCQHNAAIKFSVDNNSNYDTIISGYNFDLNIKHNGGNDLIFYDSCFYDIYDFCGDSTLKVINLSTNKLTILDYHEPSCGQVYTSLKKDGIYTISNKNVISKYNWGEKNNTKVLDLMDIDQFKNSGLTAWWHKVWGNQHVNIPENILYFRLEKDLNSDSGKYSLIDSLYPIFCKVNIKTNEIGFYGYRPNIGPGLMHNSYELYFEDSIFVTYSYNEKIERINTISGKTDVFFVKSSFDTIPIKTFEFNEATYTLQKNIKHCLETANYGPLYYNPFNKNYYRIFHPYLQERDFLGELNTDFDKECVLMIMDNDLKLKEEVVLPVKYSNLMTLYPVREGVDFYMAPKHINKIPGKTEFTYLRYKHH